MIFVYVLKLHVQYAIIRIEVFIVTFKQMEKIIMEDGWERDSCRGSHYHYKHPIKKGKVTIPFHKGDLSPIVVKMIYKQADIKGR